MGSDSEDIKVATGRKSNWSDLPGSDGEIRKGKVSNKVALCLHPGSVRVGFMHQEDHDTLQEYIYTADTVIYFDYLPHSRAKLALSLVLSNATFCVLLLLTSAVVGISKISKRPGEECFHIAEDGGLESLLALVAMTSGVICVVGGMITSVSFGLFTPCCQYVWYFLKRNKWLFASFFLGSLTLAFDSYLTAAVNLALACLLTPAACLLLDFSCLTPYFITSKPHPWVIRIFSGMWLMNYLARLFISVLHDHECQREVPIQTFVARAVSSASWITATIKMVTLLIGKLRDYRRPLVNLSVYETYSNMYIPRHHHRHDPQGVMFDYPPSGARDGKRNTEGDNTVEGKEGKEEESTVAICLLSGAVRIGPDNESPLMLKWKEQARKVLRYPYTEGRLPKARRVISILLIACTLAFIVSTSSDVFVITNATFHEVSFCFTLGDSDTADILNWVLTAVILINLPLAIWALRSLDLLPTWARYCLHWYQSNLVIMSFYILGLISLFVFDWAHALYSMAVSVFIPPVINAVIDVFTFSPYVTNPRSKGLRLASRIFCILYTWVFMLGYTARWTRKNECSSTKGMGLYEQIAVELSTAAWLAAVVKMAMLLLPKLWYLSRPMLSLYNIHDTFTYMLDKQLARLEHREHLHREGSKHVPDSETGLELDGVQL